MRPITERMAEAKVKLLARKRVPRAFYLSPADFDEFAATKPGTVEAMFALPLGSKPQPMTCLAFDGIAVRATTRATKQNGRVYSNLYCCAGTSIVLPRE